MRKRWKRLMSLERLWVCIKCQRDSVFGVTYLLLLLMDRCLYTSQPLWWMSLGAGSKCTLIPCMALGEMQHHRLKPRVLERCDPGTPSLSLFLSHTHARTTLYFTPSGHPHWGFQGPWEWINIWGKVSTLFLYLWLSTFLMLPHTGRPLYCSFSVGSMFTRGSCPGGLHRYLVACDYKYLRPHLLLLRGYDFCHCKSLQTFPIMTRACYVFFSFCSFFFCSLPVTDRIVE